MGTPIVDGEIDAPADMLQQGHLGAGNIVEGGGMIEDRKIAGLLDVGTDGAHQPQGIVIEAAADVVVAPLGQGLILVIGGAVGKLDGSDIDDPLPGPVRHDVHKAVEVLAGIPEAHAPAGAGFVVGGGAAHIEGDHALILMPDVDHPVELLVVRAKLVVTQKFVPVDGEFCQGGIYSGGVGKFSPDPLSIRLADDTGSDKFLISGVFAVAQGKDCPVAFAGGQGDLQMVAADGIPADDFGGCTPLLPDKLGIAPVAHMAQEGIPVRVPAGFGHIDTVEGIVIPALPVFGLVIDDAVLHLGFGDV